MPRVPKKSKTRYFIPSEVVVHNKPHDCWITFSGRVLNITKLIFQFRDKPCVKPLLAFAGKDVSHWFDNKTGEIRTHVHPLTGNIVPYCPHGAIPHVPPELPSTRYVPLPDAKWWKDPQYHIGYLTKKVRPIRIVNMLIHTEVTFNVCTEETLRSIMRRYSKFNLEVDKYLIRYLDKDLDMDKTLDENGIPDEREKFSELGMITSNSYVPCIFMYYKDVFTDDDSDY